MNIVIVGAGAVGGYYGAHLANSGASVTFVARGEHGRAIREHGLVIETKDGELRAKAPVVDDINAIPAGSAGLVVIAVKARSLQSVAKGVGNALAANGVALPLLNGVESEEQLASVIGSERVIGGIAQIASEVAGPGRIRVRGPGRIMLAPMIASQGPIVEAIAKTFNESGFTCRIASDLRRMLWMKLLWNAPFNGICALTRLSAGDVLAVPELEELVRAAMGEVVAVMRAEGIAVEDDLVEKSINMTRTEFPDSVPSMLQDVRAGRATEADILQGAVVRHAARHGIPAPIHTTLFALLHAIDTHAAG